MNIPMVLEQTSKGSRGWDIWSRLLKDRIVFLGEEITESVANIIIAQLLFLTSEKKNKPINLYINSRGGMVTAGLAILDTMNYIDCDVNTICVGEACSMAALLLSAGKKRCALPNARILIHQPSGGSWGQSSDIEIQTREIVRLRENLNNILAKNTGKEIEKIKKDTDRDFYMSAEEALEYGIIDKIIERT